VRETSTDERKSYVLQYQNASVANARGHGRHSAHRRPRTFVTRLWDSRLGWEIHNGRGEKSLGNDRPDATTWSKSSGDEIASCWPTLTPLLSCVRGTLIIESQFVFFAHRRYPFLFGFRWFRYVIQIEDRLRDMRRVISDGKQTVEPHNRTARTLVHQPVAQRRFVVQETETGCRFGRAVSDVRLRGPGRGSSAAARQSHALRSGQSPSARHCRLPVSNMPTSL